MKYNKNLTNLYNVFIYVVLLLFLVYLFDAYLSNVNLCDNGSINDIGEINQNNDKYNPSHLSQLHFIDRCRRRISWYIHSINKEGYSSYSQFKNSWNPKTNIWDEVKIAIKEDINKSRAKAFKYKQESRINNERLMSDIKTTKDNSNKIRMDRYIERLNAARRK
jgi:hypothetical protein